MSISPTAANSAGRVVSKLYPVQPHTFSASPTFVPCARTESNPQTIPHLLTCWRVHSNAPGSASEGGFSDGVIDEVPVLPMKCPFFGGCARFESDTLAGGRRHGQAGCGQLANCEGARHNQSDGTGRMANGKAHRHRTPQVFAFLRGPARSQYPVNWARMCRSARLRR